MVQTQIFYKWTQNPKDLNKEGDNRSVKKSHREDENKERWHIFLCARWLTSMKTYKEEEWDG